MPGRRLTTGRVAAPAPDLAPRGRPPLPRSRPKERHLVVAAGRGDKAARTELVEAFTPLIASVARRYRSSAAVNRVELMQEGVVGLLTALDRFDPGRGTPFWAYASWWVRQAMQQLVAELARPVVLSDRALRQLARIKDARREYAQAHRRDPSTAQIAETTGFPQEQVESLMAVERTPRSLEEPVGGDPDAGPFGDLLADPRADDEYEGVVRRLMTEELGDLPSRLCERERTILRARFGLDGPEQTLRQIAGRLGLSAERVRQIEEQALGRLRASVIQAA